MNRSLIEPRSKQRQFHEEKLEQRRRKRKKGKRGKGVERVRRAKKSKQPARTELEWRGRVQSGAEGNGGGSKGGRGRGERKRKGQQTREKANEEGSIRKDRTAFAGAWAASWLIPPEI